MRHTVQLPNQREGEVVELVLRKHWISHFHVLFFLFTTFIVPLGVYIGLFFSFRNEFFTETSKILSAFFMLYLLFVVLFTYIKWLNEEFDVLIITNYRIMSVNQIGFLSREFSESSLMQIQDVKGRSKGFFSSFFDFGTLEAQTAADKILFTIDYIPKPLQHVNKILELRDKHKGVSGV